MKSLFRIALAGLLATFGVVIVSAQAPDSDDVAAAARKAREQQKTAPKPKKVVTNDDMPSRSTDSDAKPSPPSAEGQAASGQTDQAQVSKGENDPKKEAYWRKRSADLRDKLAQAEKDLSVLQRELNTDQVQYYNDPQKALVEQHNRGDISEKTSKVDAKKKEIDSIKEQISNLEDDCRKAGGDPGWVR